MAVINSHINSGIINELVEGVDNSSIVPTNPPVRAREGLASETNSPASAVTSAKAWSAVERMEAE